MLTNFVESVRVGRCLELEGIDRRRREGAFHRTCLVYDSAVLLNNLLTNTLHSEYLIYRSVILLSFSSTSLPQTRCILYCGNIDEPQLFQICRSNSGAVTGPSNFFSGALLRSAALLRSFKEQIYPFPSYFPS